MDEGREVIVAGWPVARQHPRGQKGTVFVTLEDETGDVQLILWPRVFTRHRGELKSNVLLVKGVVSRWDGHNQRRRLGPAELGYRRPNARRPRLALRGDRKLLTTPPEE